MKNAQAISDRKVSLELKMDALEWPDDNEAEFADALRARRRLGSLPLRLLGTSVEFDYDEARTYGGIAGAGLASLAARLVLTARRERRFMHMLRGVAAAMIGPLVAYMRVYYAAARLEAAIETACDPNQDIWEAEDGGITGIGHVNSRPSGSAASPPAGMTDKSSGTPVFRWRKPPKDVYGFAKAKAALGYDPRETSVYWIEKRAANLRRRWERYGAARAGGDLRDPRAEPSFESRCCAPPQDEERCVLQEGHDFTSPAPPHAEERQSRPSKQGKEMQISGLQPSFESPDCVRPQDEEVGVLQEGYDFTSPAPPHAEERRSRPLKQGEELQSHGLSPSFESRCCASPQDEERGMLLEERNLASPIPHAEERQSRPSKQGKEMQTSGLPHQAEETDIPVRDFVPVDADYNTIWPPVTLPKGPPKTRMDQAELDVYFEYDEELAAEGKEAVCAAAPAPVLRLEDHSQALAPGFEACEMVEPRGADAAVLSPASAFSASTETSCGSQAETGNLRGRAGRAPP